MKLTLVLSVILSLFVQTPPPDTTVPVIKLIAPEENTLLKDLRAIAFTAEDAGGLLAPKVFVDGLELPGLQLTAGDSPTPSALSKHYYGIVHWLTSSVPDGPHVIKVVAVDAAKNEAMFQLAVNVRNAPASPTPVPGPGPFAARAISFRGAATLQLVEGRPNTWINMDSFIVYADRTASIRLWAGHGTACQDNREPLTQEYVLSDRQAMLFPSRPIPNTKSVCVATGTGGANIRGDVSSRHHPLE